MGDPDPSGIVAVPEADYHHQVDTIIGAGVHVVSARQDPDTSKEGVIHGSERLFSQRESAVRSVGIFVGTLFQNSAKLRAFLYTSVIEEMRPTA